MPWILAHELSMIVILLGIAHPLWTHAWSQGVLAVAVHPAGAGG